MGETTNRFLWLAGAVMLCIPTAASGEVEDDAREPAAHWLRDIPVPGRVVPMRTLHMTTMKMNRNESSRGCAIPIRSVLLPQDDASVDIGGVGLGSGSAVDGLASVYLDGHVGWKLSRSSAWVVSMAAHAREQERIRGTTVRMGMFVETGYQFWLGSRLWLRPTVGLTIGGDITSVETPSEYNAPEILVIDNRPSGRDSSHYVAPSASITAGMKLFDLPERFASRSNNGVDRQPGVVGFVRAGRLFGSHLPDTHFNRNYVVLGVAVHTD